MAASPQWQTLSVQRGLNASGCRIGAPADCRSPVSCRASCDRADQLRYPFMKTPLYLQTKIGSSLPGTAARCLEVRYKYVLVTRCWIEFVISCLGLSPSWQARNALAYALHTIEYVRNRVGSASWNCYCDSRSNHLYRPTSPLRLLMCH